MIINSCISFYKEYINHQANDENICHKKLLTIKK